MSRASIALIVGLLSTGIGYADVRTDERALVKFEGMLGRMVNLFGGRGGREGLVSTVAVKGDRKMTLTGDIGQIVDLREEKIYDLNMKDRSYEVTTFAELRREMEEARKRASEQAPRRYAEALGTPIMLDAQQMATVMAMYPAMDDAIAKFQAENVNMDGTPVMTVVKFEAVMGAAQAQQQQQAAKEDESKPVTGLGGLGGRLGRRIINRGNDQSPAGGPTARTTVMTMQHEILKVSAAVSDADVAIPAGFKQK